MMFSTPGVDFSAVSPRRDGPDRRNIGSIRPFRDAGDTNGSRNNLDAPVGQLALAPRRSWLKRYSDPFA
jgi:hypothetical protein